METQTFKFSDRTEAESKLKSIANKARKNGSFRTRREWPIAMVAAISASMPMYVSAKSAEGTSQQKTSDLVNSCITYYMQECARACPSKAEIEEFEGKIAAHLDLVEEALAYYRSLEFRPKTGFDQNLQTAANLAGCEPGGPLFGVLCYLPWAYKKHIGDTAKKEALASQKRPSEFIPLPAKGAKNKRVVIQATVIQILTFNGDYGYSEKIIMQTPEGDVVTCPSLTFKFDEYYNEDAQDTAGVYKINAPYRVSSSEPGLDGKVIDHTGSVLVFSGIPSKHVEYKGTKQTHMTRCNIMEWVKIVENGVTVTPQQCRR